MFDIKGFAMTGVDQWDRVVIWDGEAKGENCSSPEACGISHERVQMGSRNNLQEHGTCQDSSAPWRIQETTSYKHEHKVQVYRAHKNVV